MIKNNFKKATAKIRKTKRPASSKKTIKISKDTWGIIFNIAILIGIISLFSLLIANVINSRKNIVNINNYAPSTIHTSRIPNSLPLETQEIEKIVEAKSDNKKCIAQGDVTVDGDFPASKKICSREINGNLYLQNMHKYTLPCGIVIQGDLFIRDVGLVSFCRNFVVTGNIYVSRRSSFGAIPKSAKVGGQIIL